MINYGSGGGWSGPSQARRGIAPFSPIEQAFQSARAARSTGPVPAAGGRMQVLPDQDAEIQAQLAEDPSIIGPGDPRLDSDATPEEAMQFATQPRSFTIGGRPYQRDPRLALGLELARAQQARGVQNQEAVDQGQRAQAAQDARVQRLVDSGYSKKEATRQVFGGPQTVAEQQELINTRSTDALAKDKQLQGEIGQRQQAAQAARSTLQQLLERSRSGDRQASRQLVAQKAILADATRAHTAALKARTSNALGGTDLGDPSMDPEDIKLNAAVDEHLNDVQSSEAARRGAIAGIARAGASNAPGATNISDTDAAAFLGVRQPGQLNDGAAGSVAADPMAKYHRAFQKGTLPHQTGPGQGLPPAPKPLEDHMHDPASTDQGYRAWLQQKGYDVSGVPRAAAPASPPNPDDQQQDFQQDENDDQGAELQF